MRPGLHSYRKGPQGGLCRGASLLLEQAGGGGGDPRGAERSAERGLIRFRLLSSRKVLAELLVTVAIGHASQVVANSAPETDFGGAVPVQRRQQLWSREIALEHLMNPGLRAGAHFEQARMAVD